MRVKLFVPGTENSLFEYPVEMPCRLNKEDILNVEDLVDLDKLDDEEKKSVAKESFYVKMTAFHKDEEGIYQFVMLSRGSEAK